MTIQAPRGQELISIFLSFHQPFLSFPSHLYTDFLHILIISHFPLYRCLVHSTTAILRQTNSQNTDDAAAESAVRNLKGVQVKDRSLRIEMSSDTPNHRQGGGGGGGRQGGGAGGRGGGMGGGMGGGRGRSPPPPFRQPPPPGAGYGGPPPPNVPPYAQGPGVGGGYNAPPPVVPPPRVDLGMVPPGQDLPRGESAMDQISKTLASIGPGQMQDVMAGMKVSRLLTATLCSLAQNGARRSYLPVIVLTLCL